MADLTGRLAAEYANFDFFQAVSLLEEYFLDKDKTADPITAGKIRFMADDSIAFPPNDVAGIKVDKGVVRFILTFMGLTGSSSPLPQYFSDYVQMNSAASPALRDFLAIFNNRLYGLFYRSWKKYHFMRTFSARGTDPFSERVAALAGIDMGTSPDPRTIRMLSYAGILAGRSRGPAGLQAVLSDFFGNIPVTVRQWVPRWANMPDPPRIGANAQLGVNAMAGTRVWDVSGKFRIILGPLSRDTYETFLPGSDNILRVQQITRSYLNDPLSFDVEVQLQSTDLTPVVLGADSARLGTTSSLGRSDQKSSVQSITIE
jgi:type VI secretion system protein ImpH